MIEKHIVLEDLSNDADTRFFHIYTVKVVKIADDLTAHLLKFAVGQQFILCDKGDYFFFPFLMQCIRRSFYCFIRTCAVQTAKENIAKL